MGKPTGFMEYPRELPLARSPLERTHDWNEFHEHSSEEMLRKQGRAAWIAASHSATPARFSPKHGVGLSGQQSYPGVERSRLSRPVAGSARSFAQDQQLPRIHRPRLPGAMRRVVRAWHQRAGRHDQEHRMRDHRPGLRGGLGRAGTAAVSHRQESRRRRFRAGGARLPPPSSTRPATGSPSSNEPIASAAC